MAETIIENGINNYVSEVYGCEAVLYYDGNYKFAGTADAIIGSTDNKIKILDFKQSNRPKKREYSVITQYGVKCFGFLTKISWGKYYNYFYVGSIVFSALVTVEVVIGIIDLSFALMCIPNMIAVVYLSKFVTNEMKERKWFV